MKNRRHYRTAVEGEVRGPMSNWELDQWWSKYGNLPPSEERCSRVRWRIYLRYRRRREYFDTCDLA